MATVRVFLCTYRRNQLLRRAIASLLAQTFGDWECELHNDDPSDPFPARLADEVGDARIRVVRHDRNLGPTGTLNQAFRAGVTEPYVCILEDDNWWDAAFLATMVGEMDRRPAVQVGWANMRLSVEQPDGSWVDTGRCIWGPEWGKEPVLFNWPDVRQIRGALHSNGAMLVRTVGTDDLLVPESTPFATIEGVRERLFRHPLLLVPAPLAHFAVTRSTARGRDRAHWGQCQALLAASFFRHVRLAPAEARRAWADARSSRPPATSALVAGTLIDRRARYMLRYARPTDLVRFAAGLIRRPRTGIRVLRAKAELPVVWSALDAATRQTHARAGGPTRLAANEPSGGGRN